MFNVSQKLNLSFPLWPLLIYASNVNIILQEEKEVAAKEEEELEDED